MTLTVTKSRTVNMDKNGGDDNVTATIVKEYYVEDDAADPSLMDPDTVLSHDDIPQVNVDVFRTESGGVLPYMLCRSVRAQQHQQRLSRWSVEATFKGLWSQPELTVDSLADLRPQVFEELGEMNQVLYIDKNYTQFQPNGRRIMTPTGNWYAEPAMERIATRIRTVMQYEAFVSYETTQARRFKTNKSPYLGQPQYSWLITDVKGQTVRVPRASGGTLSVAKMTYVLAHNPDIFGWKDSRALVDTHHLDPLDLDDAGEPKKLEFKEGNLRTANIGLIDGFGVALPDQTVLPEYDSFVVQPELVFQTFLQA